MENLSNEQLKKISREEFVAWTNQYLGKIPRKDFLKVYIDANNRWAKQHGAIFRISSGGRGKRIWVCYAEAIGGSGDFVLRGASGLNFRCFLTKEQAQKACDKFNA